MATSMSMSGIKLADRIKDEFKKLNLDKDQQWMVLKIGNGIVDIDEDFKNGRQFVQKTDPSLKKDCVKKVFMDFMARLPKDAPRWVVYSFTCQDDGGCNYQDRIAFIDWCPENAHIKLKMMHGSTTDAVKKQLAGNLISKRISELDEIDGTFCEIFDTCQKHK